jgi:uncharacterized delta-60 repeat protein
MAAVLGLAALAVCAAALAMPARVEKEQLAPWLQDTEELRVYGDSRLLLLEGYGGKVTRIHADGSLDRSFGDRGRLEADYADVIVDPQGRLLLAGSAAPPGHPGNEDAQVTRLLPNGRPDRSFGDKGVAYVDMGGRYDGAAALALDRRHRIVVGGSKQTQPASRGLSNATPALARLRPDGSLDRSFGNRGVTLPPFGGESGVLSLGIDGDGGIVAEGEAYVGTAVWRLEESGALDRHFGKKGVVTIEGRGRREEYGREEEFELADRVGVRPDGRILLAGTGSTYGERTRYRLVALRLRRDGRLDRTYGRHGYATAQFADWTFIGSVSFLSGGGLVAVGSAQAPNHKRSDVGLIALNGDGRLNRRLIPKGKMTVHLPGWGGGEEVALQRGRASILGMAGKSTTKLWLVRVVLPRNPADVPSRCCASVIGRSRS